MGVRLAHAVRLNMWADMLVRGASADVWWEEQVLAPSAFRSVLQWCHRLDAFDLSAHTEVTDSEIGLLAAKFGAHLHDLDMAGCRRVTDVGLAMLASRCLNMRMLNLSGCNNITDQGLRELSKHCNELQTLYIASCRKVTCQGLACLAEGCPKLQDLIFNARTWINHEPAILNDLLARSPRLEDLLSRNWQVAQGVECPPKAPIFDAVGKSCF